MGVSSEVDGSVGDFPRRFVEPVRLFLAKTNADEWNSPVIRLRAVTSATFKSRQSLVFYWPKWFLRCHSFSLPAAIKAERPFFDPRRAFSSLNRPFFRSSDPSSQFLLDSKQVYFQVDVQGAFFYHYLSFNCLKVPIYIILIALEASTLIRVLTF